MKVSWWPSSLRFVDQYFVDQYFFDQYFVDEYFVFKTTVKMQALKNILLLLLYFTCQAFSTLHIEQIHS